MKTFLASLFLILLSACAKSDRDMPPIREAEKAVPYSTSSYVLAEPLPGRKLKISITAPDKSIYIVNCNEHIVVALFKKGSDIPVWGGLSNACLSQNIIVPAKSTLSFVIPIGERAPDLALDISYTAQIFHVLTASDLKSPDVSSDLITSNEFKLKP
jgi:hypothetical protein